MGNITLAISYFLPALIIALILYLPFLVYRLKKDSSYPIVRHVFCFALILYLVMLFIIVFIWQTFPMTSFFGGGFNFNLFPFTEFAKQYMLYDGFYLSQLMLNIIMFIPLGFLLPIVFPYKVNRFYKTALIALFTTVTIELIQFFIGRFADIDDVIANLAGAICGYSLFIIFSFLFKNAAFYKQLMFNIAPPFKGFSVPLVHSVIFIMTFLLPALCDYVDARSEYGILRYNSSHIPKSALCSVPLDENETQGVVTSYSRGEKQTSDVTVISEKEAFEKTHSLGMHSYSLVKDIVIDTVEPTVQYIKGKEVPAYIFSGTGIAPGGREIIVYTIVDALKR